MKKLVSLAGLAFVACGALAQGTIGFGNDATTLITTNDGTHSGVALSSMSPRVVLYYSSSASPPPINVNNLFDLTGWTLASPTTPVSVGIPVAGRFANTTKTADNVSPGGNVWLMVRGWAGGFADWNAALTAYPSDPNVFIGFTTVLWQQGTGNPASTPAGTPVNMVLGPSGFNGLTLYRTPEPSTFAIAGLGLLSMWLWRCRKNST